VALSIIGGYHETAMRAAGLLVGVTVGTGVFVGVAAGAEPYS
jgi:hypothetical protein